MTDARERPTEDTPMTDARERPWSEHRQVLERLSHVTSAFMPDEIDALRAALALGDRCAQTEQKFKACDKERMEYIRFNLRMRDTLDATRQQADAEIASLRQQLEQMKDELRETREMDEHHRDERDRIQSQLTTLRAALARRKRQTCETCKFHGQVSETGFYQFCQLDFSPEGHPALTVRYDFPGKPVPLSVNGQPFGCAGWQPREEQ